MNIVESLKEKFSGTIKQFRIDSNSKIYIEIDKKDLLNMVYFIFVDMDARFITASGVDNLDGMEILYHFSFDREDVIISLRVLLERENPIIESISSIIRGAINIEKEIYELLGIQFLHHPELKRFLLSEEYPDNVYPLRKDNREGKK